MTADVWVTGLAGAVLALMFIRLATLGQRLDRLSRVEAKLDALLKHSGVEFDAYQDVPPDVQEALDRGQTLLAIKRLRQSTGVDLKAAKQFIDEVRRRKAAAG